jgi:HAD superfamily hydrolase (TIGR01509 family)
VDPPRTPESHGIDAVIFDCDGTLVDSEPLARDAWDRALAGLGYTVSDDEYAGLVGLPYPRVHAYFAERVGGMPDADTFWVGFSAMLFDLIDSVLEPFDDAVETVRALHGQGIAVAVASSSPRERLDRTLRRAGLAGTFAVTVAGDEVARGKPAPDMFLAAAARLGAAPARCVVVEDTGPGVAAALAAGMRTIGVARPGASPPALAGAHAVVERLSAAAVLTAAGGA